MKRTIIAAGVVLLSLASLKADDKQARVLMQAAEAKATVQGDLKAAIALYQSAVKEAGQDRATAAQAASARCIRHPFITYSSGGFMAPRLSRNRPVARNGTAMKPRNRARRSLYKSVAMLSARTA